VVSFRNSHLVYALTWFALAALSGGAAVVALRTRGGR
jgi:surfeit locus 1 family protein